MKDSSPKANSSVKDLGIYLVSHSPGLQLAEEDSSPKLSPGQEMALSTRMEIFGSYSGELALISLADLGWSL